MSPRALSLFSGIGLHDLGLCRAGWELAAQVEIDPWCRAVLEKHWPGLPRWEDVRDVTAESILGLGRIDLVTGGFPCPDLSTAGKGMGLLRGERSSLWFQMLRIIELVRPAWVLAENVPALYSRGIDSVLTGLEDAGYAAWPVVVGAWAVGAPHRRDRVWIVGRRVGDAGCGTGERDDDARKPDAARRGPGAGRVADPERDALRHLQQREPAGRLPGSLCDSGEAESGGLRAGGVAYPNGSGLPLDPCEPGDHGAQRAPALGDGGSRGWPGWPSGRFQPQHPWEPPRLVFPGRGIPEPGMGGSPDGSAAGLDGAPGGDRPGAVREARFLSWCRRERLKALGNANPPDVPEIIGRWMLAAKGAK